MLLRPEGLVHLGLYFRALASIEVAGDAARKLIIDLSCASDVTDSGCAALLAIDRLCEGLAMGVDVLDPDPWLVSRMEPLCPATRWRARRCALAAEDAAHSNRASSP